MNLTENEFSRLKNNVLEEGEYEFLRELPCVVSETKIVSYNNWHYAVSGSTYWTKCTGVNVKSIIAKSKYPLKVEIQSGGSVHSHTIGTITNQN